MSFILNVKNEIITNYKKALNKNESLSFLYGLFLTCGEINIKSKELEFFVSSENLYDLIDFSLSKLGFDGAELEIEDGKTQKFRVKVSKSASESLLKKFVYEKNFEFNDELINNEGEKKNFLKAVFLIAGTGNIVLNGDANGYLLEFVLSAENVAEAVSGILCEFDILPKMITRQNLKVVYLNKFDQICDFLALCGATKSVLELNNENILRDVRNNINRQNNCIEANISKTINASLKQLDAINFIDNVIGIGSLEASLQEVCLLRLANKEESLDNLVKLMNGKISKSGLNHRLNKIVKIADDLKGKF
ncbi:MAG: DNA-binding protein WhiA [Christensenellales bacterium]